MAPACQTKWTQAQRDAYKDLLPTLAERKVRNNARNLKVRAYYVLQSEVFADLRYVAVGKFVLQTWWREMERILGCNEQNNDPAAVWEFWRTQHSLDEEDSVVAELNNLSL